MPQQLQPYVAGPSNSQPHDNVSSAPQGPFNQTSQANTFYAVNLVHDGFVATHPANESVNHNAAANQLGNSNKPTPDDVSKMQYNLLFGPVLNQPKLPGPSQAPGTSQAAGDLTLESMIDPALWEAAPMDFTYQSQAQTIQQPQAPPQQQEVQQTVQQHFHYQPAEVGPTQQAEGEDDSDLFGDIDFEQELANSLQPLVDFNARN